MPKVSDAVRRETLWVAAWTGGLCLVMHLVFALIGQWNTGVLLGSLLGFAVAVGNFFWMAMRIQKAVGLPEKDARRIIQSSMMMRMLLLAGTMILGFTVAWLNGWATVIPLIFPSIAVKLRPLWKKGLDADPAVVEQMKNAPREDAADDQEGGGELD